jgi:hypothetical protein
MRLNSPRIRPSSAARSMPAAIHDRVAATRASASLMTARRPKVWTRRREPTSQACRCRAASGRGLAELSGSSTLPCRYPNASIWREIPHEAGPNWRACYRRVIPRPPVIPAFARSTGKPEFHTPIDATRDQARLTLPSKAATGRPRSRPSAHRHRRKEGPVRGSARGSPSFSPFGNRAFAAFNAGRIEIDLDQLASAELF